MRKAEAAGSGELRNHGTKFRVSPENVCRLYTKRSDLAEEPPS